MSTNLLIGLICGIAAAVVVMVLGLGRGLPSWVAALVAGLLGALGAIAVTLALGAIPVGMPAAPGTVHPIEPPGVAAERSN